MFLKDKNETGICSIKYFQFLIIYNGGRIYILIPMVIYAFRPSADHMPGPG